MLQSFKKYLNKLFAFFYFLTFHKCSLFQEFTKIVLKLLIFLWIRIIALSVYCFHQLVKLFSQSIGFSLDIIFWYIFLLLLIKWPWCFSLYNHYFISFKFMNKLNTFFYKSMLVLKKMHKVYIFSALFDPRNSNEVWKKGVNISKMKVGTIFSV